MWLSYGPGKSPARTRDFAKEAAAKAEHTRIHIAYSRACIEIDAFLKSRGVSGLPAHQETPVTFLNSVIVAVMGLDVKDRESVRRIFCDAAGQERLWREFIRYFELSPDREALARQVAAAGHALHASEKALAAWQRLEAER